MSLDCEATELTPLRRGSQSRRQQQSLNEQTQHPEQPNELESSHQVVTSALNHLQSSDTFNGYMSINNNNHPAGSDSSRADTSEPNSQQAFNPKSYIMSDTKRVIARITIDGAILLSGESLLI